MIKTDKEQKKLTWFFIIGLIFGVTIGMIFGQLSLITYAGKIFDTIEINEVKIGLNETTITKLVMKELNPEVCLIGCMVETGNITEKCYNTFIVISLICPSIPQINGLNSK